MRTLLTLLSMGLGLCLLVSCADTKQQKLPCTQDYNCDQSTQACYQGFCTNKADIPKNQEDGGPADVAPPQDEPPKDAPVTRDEPAPKDDAPQDVPAPRDEPAPQSYPPGPYGADVDDVAIPLELAQCDGKGTMSFEKFYKHEQIKVLLVTVHTGW